MTELHQQDANGGNRGTGERAPMADQLDHSLGIPSTERQNAILDTWSGASALVWVYSPSLPRLAILLDTDPEREPLYVIAVGCEFISGPFTWKNANIQIHYSGGQAEGGCQIVDELAGFNLVCSSAKRRQPRGLRRWVRGDSRTMRSFTIAKLKVGDHEAA